MGVVVSHVKGLAFSAMSESGHLSMMDARKEVGGSEGGPMPMELLLESLMGCTGMDVISILNKMKQAFTSFEIHEEHEKADEHPKIFKRIHMIYRFEGGEIDPEKVKKACRLSMERYCPVTAMLSKVVEISYDIEINGDRIPADSVIIPLHRSVRPVR